MEKEIDENIIQDVIEEIEVEIKTCGVMNNSRPRKDCGVDCKYRDICNIIFERNDIQD